MAKRERYEVERMPPIWRRSLTESGMERSPTILDRVVVVLFLIICLGVIAWLAAQYGV